MMHPCFHAEARGRFGRMHLPVAPRCNIQCAYCDRRNNCVNESRPGVAARVVSPKAACDLALKAVERMPHITVAGIAGPGDPLANPVETLETLRLVHQALPRLFLCLSTNGLALPDYAADLATLGVSHITVTVNAVDPDIGARIISSVAAPEKALSGGEGAACLIGRQLDGIAAAKKHGLTIKVNMVIVPGINDRHASQVAMRIARAGAELMNCIPLAPVPGTRLGNIREPDAALMAATRAEAEKWLPQMRHCARCRADALGLLGEKHILDELAAPRFRCGCVNE